MRHSFADHFADLDSLISRLPVRLKIISCLILVILVVITPIRFKFIFLFYSLFIAFLIIISRIPLLFFLKRLVEILPFLALVAFSAPFIQKNGWLIFTSCLLKSILIITTITLLIQTTHFNQLLNALGNLKTPRLIIMLLSFMYRYLFVLEDEILRKKRALDLRSCAGKGFRILRPLANMAGSLFIRTYERAERIYLAMCARGYEGSQDD